VSEIVSVAGSPGLAQFWGIFRCPGRRRALGRLRRFV
jgi:hypothetical protein